MQSARGMPISDSRLLIVDDDPFIAALLQRILANAGYEIVLSTDGQAALDLLNEDSAFDAVLLDRQMPGLNGLQVLGHMKCSEALKDIPVVLQTVLDNEEEIQEGLRAGALYYLVKPLDPRLVLQVVAAATDDFATRRKFWAEVAGTRSAMGLIQRGVFQCRTLQQCHDLAALLAKACPDPRRSVIGLSELLINALEHGNLGITYAEKSALIEARGWASEVERRQALPEHAAKWITITLTRSTGSTRFLIEDMGAGFSWQEYQAPSTDRLFDSHGRGILLAKWESFDRVEYQGVGNCVIAEIDHPAGFHETSG